MKEGLNNVDVYTFEDTDANTNKSKKFLDTEMEEGYVSIDDWKPSISPSAIVQSEWRKKSITGDFEGRPGLDDLLKIRKHLKKGVPDFQIMQTFGIDSETLFAIKKDKYCPVDGILKDTIVKEFEEFKSHMGTELRETRRKVTALSKGINELVSLLSEDNKELFIRACRNAEVKFDMVSHNKGYSSADATNEPSEAKMAM